MFFNRKICLQLVPSCSRLCNTTFTKHSQVSQPMPAGNHRALSPRFANKPLRDRVLASSIVSRVPRQLKSTKFRPGHVRTYERSFLCSFRLHPRRSIIDPTAQPVIKRQQAVAEQARQIWVIPWHGYRGIRRLLFSVLFRPSRVGNNCRRIDRVS